uniref:Uncharacterized protein n=1 Tax=Acrobeloides nanus TaxID=290746 RepID=A0A914CDG6_9BILA
MMKIVVPVFNALMELPLNIIAQWITIKYFKRGHVEPLLLGSLARRRLARRPLEYFNKYSQSIEKHDFHTIFTAKLGEVQTCAKAAFLSDEEQELLKERIRQL